MRRLPFFHEFAVAIIDEHDGIGRKTFDGVDCALTFRDREGAARGISARALHEHRREIAGRARIFKRAKIKTAFVAQRDLAILDARRYERMRRVANGVAQRVVRRPRNREQRSPWRRARRQRSDDCVRSAHDRKPRDRALRAQNSRQERFVTRPRRIVVAVTRRTGQVAFDNAFLDECVEYVRVNALLRRIRDRDRSRIRLERRLTHPPLDAEALAELLDHSYSCITWRSYARTKG